MLHEDGERHDGGLVREARLDEGLLLYDTDNEDAWIQSDTPVEVG